MPEAEQLAGQPEKRRPHGNRRTRAVIDSGISEPTAPDCSKSTRATRGYPEWQRTQGSGAETYLVCMTRTDIDIDDEMCRRVMERYHLTTKREAVTFALRHLAGEPLDLAEARSLRGSGWDGDIDVMRQDPARG